MTISPARTWLDLNPPLYQAYSVVKRDSLTVAATMTTFVSHEGLKCGRHSQFKTIPQSSAEATFSKRKIPHVHVSVKLFFRRNALFHQECDMCLPSLRDSEGGPGNSSLHDRTSPCFAGKACPRHSSGIRDTSPVGIRIPPARGFLIKPLRNDTFRVESLSRCDILGVSGTYTTTVVASCQG